MRNIAARQLKADEETAPTTLVSTANAAKLVSTAHAAYMR